MKTCIVRQTEENQFDLSDDWITLIKQTINPIKPSIIQKINKKKKRKIIVSDFLHIKSGNRWKFYSYPVLKIIYLFCLFGICHNE